jgi:hypothetical protein
MRSAWTIASFRHSLGFFPEDQHRLLGEDATLRVVVDGLEVAFPRISMHGRHYIGSHDSLHPASLNTHEPSHTIVTIHLLREHPLPLSQRSSPQTVVVWLT